MTPADKPDTFENHNVRADVIRAVGTPLGFFALVVLVIEAILGAVAVAGVGIDRTLAISGMLVVVVGLILVVAYFAYHRPEALSGLRHKEEIDAKSLTAPLQDQLDLVCEENQRLRAELARLASLRLKVLAVLGADSADPSLILGNLGLSNDPTAK